jgi:prepilin-type N-terminal cleavage/methylation domain-containing protein
MMASHKRFTLVELLVVIAIIAVLAGLLLPALAGAQNQAKRTRAQTEMKGLQTAITMYESDYGVLPVSQTPPPTTECEALDDAQYTALINYLQGGNPRNKRYLEIVQGPLGGPGVMNDPWSTTASNKQRYRVALDLNYDGQINANTSSPPNPPRGPDVIVYGRVAVWSVGKNRVDNLGAASSDDVATWRQ